MYYVLACESILQCWFTQCLVTLVFHIIITCKSYFILNIYFIILVLVLVSGIVVVTLVVLIMFLVLYRRLVFIKCGGRGREMRCWGGGRVMMVGCRDNV